MGEDCEGSHEGEGREMSSDVHRGGVLQGI